MSIVQSFNDLARSVEKLGKTINDPRYELPVMQHSKLVQEFSWLFIPSDEHKTGEKVMCRICGDNFDELDPKKGFANVYCSRECGIQDMQTVHDTCELCEKRIFPVDERVEGEQMHTSCAKQADEDYFEAVHEYEVNVQQR